MEFTVGPADSVNSSSESSVVAAISTQTEFGHESPCGSFEGKSSRVDVILESPDWIFSRSSGRLSTLSMLAETESATSEILPAMREIGALISLKKLLASIRVTSTAQTLPVITFAPCKMYTRPMMEHAAYQPGNEVPNHRRAFFTLCVFADSLGRLTAAAAHAAGRQRYPEEEHDDT